MSYLCHSEPSVSRFCKAKSQETIGEESQWIQRDYYSNTNSVGI